MFSFVLWIGILRKENDHLKQRGHSCLAHFSDWIPFLIPTLPKWAKTDFKGNEDRDLEIKVTMIVQHWACIWFQKTVHWKLSEVLALISQRFRAPFLPKEQENLLPFTLVAFLRALLSATNPYNSGTDHRSEVAAAGASNYLRRSGNSGPLPPFFAFGNGISH